LFVLDANANVVQSFKITETGAAPISGFTGMTKDPTNSTIYVVVNGTPRYLATLNEGANTITKIANLSDKISGIACNSLGALFGISGDGATLPRRLFSINKTSGVMTQLADFSADINDDGESIGFNSTDNFMYRLAGGNYVYKINLSNNTETLITDALANAGVSGHALYYDGSNFISMTNSMCTMTAAGVQTNCNQIDLNIKGILPRTIVGLDPVEPSILVKVYPNPTSSQLTIELSEGTSEQFMITDNTGKVLKQGAMESLKTNIDVSDLSAGMYFVTIGNAKTKLMIR